ncbi:MAG: carbohydrate kinase family protein, partial [Bosea sp. (in: a-proteobacteria)]
PIAPPADGVEDGIPALAAWALFAFTWPRLLPIPRGARGAVAIGRDGSVTPAPAPSVDVVDLTGAGDAFVGALLAAWLNGAAVDAALRLACAAGSLQTTRFGAQEVLPAADQLARLAGLPADALQTFQPESGTAS